MSNVLSGQMTQQRPKKVTLGLADATSCMPPQASADRDVLGRACPVHVRTSGGAVLSPPRTQGRTAREETDHQRAAHPSQPAASLGSSPSEAGRQVGRRAEATYPGHVGSNPASSPFPASLTLLSSLHISCTLTLGEDQSLRLQSKLHGVWREAAVPLHAKDIGVHGAQPSKTRLALLKQPGSRLS